MDKRVERKLHQRNSPAEQQNEHIKRCSPSIVIREMHLTTKVTKIKKTDNFKELAKMWENRTLLC
jgi:hypothetical protein